MGKWIFTDVDGTLLTEAQEIPEATQIAIQQLKTRPDTHLIVTTGRSITSARAVLSGVFEPAWHFPGIYSDGLVAFGADENDVICDYGMDPVKAQVLISTLKEQFPDCVYIMGSRFADCVPEVTEDLKGFFDGWHEHVLVASSVAEVQEKTGCPVHRIAIPGQKAELDVIQTWLDEKFGADFRICRMADTIIVIMKPGWSKWEAIKKLAKHYEIDLVNDVITIGDGINDLEMLRECQTSIAMGNATTAVKSQAKKVTSHILENGWVEGVLPAL
eukprot:Blabericola_migrator_1__8278@NODE_4297_length_1234_cov_129_608398_g2657_i0_p1_GENE_NODE_4297_length_1234_cov_129_608398_g2657_i0NODE_4297_length_1234_cov_129_608398_g2657_i0_p1_ORF_typecomplete_len273_score53_35Hydrolase_3/PF08282_12/1_4e44S6PP/PF05116_13/7S6PP/PF05116_13/3_8e08Trehalose_PPase/PF02358_16/0_068Trehalose_PPase/PF02358_16/0_069HAD/PF12710_7/40HAD/PF12710_7/0_0046Hydrolase_6/PF13344_6/0_055Hydrolase/PF00702_26/2_1e02Hydrolase/PF00702_26/2_2Mur_ligase_C/PF02875_21/3_4e03Mur_ligase_C/